MEKIIMYRTSDGRLFEKEESAEEYEKELAIYQKAKDCVRNAYFANMAESDIIDVVVEFYTKNLPKNM